MFQKFRNVKFERAVSSSHVLGVRHLLPIQPDVRPIIDAVKMQPVVFPGPTRWRRKFRPKPPRTSKWAARRHIHIGEHFILRNIYPRKVLQIRSIVRIRIGFIGHQNTHHCRGDVRAVPTLRREPSCGNLVAPRFVLAR